jgi:hypothetical protein
MTSFAFHILGYLRWVSVLEEKKKTTYTGSENLLHQIKEEGPLRKKKPPHQNIA